MAKNAPQNERPFTKRDFEAVVKAANQPLPKNEAVSSKQEAGNNEPQEEQRHDSEERSQRQV